MAGRQAVVVAADDYGPAEELAGLAERSGVAHHVLFRLTKAGTERYEDGQRIDFDVPRYELDPVDAAAEHLRVLCDHLPPAFDKARVWLIPINEVNKLKADWLGWFSYHFAQLAIPMGFKVGLPGWAAGEPEPEDWATPGWLAYFRLCENMPGQACLITHEYSYDAADMRTGAGFMVGRFTQAYDVCDRHGIARPTVYVTELGWTLDDAPGVAKSLEDVAWSNALFSQYDDVWGALWYLGAGFGNIADKVQRLIVPITDMALAAPIEPPEPPEPPGPPDMGAGCDARVAYKRVTYVLPQRATLQRLTDVAKVAYTTRSGVGFSYDDAGIGCGLTSRRAVLVDIPQAEQATFLDWYATHYPGVTVDFMGGAAEEDPFADLLFGHPMRPGHYVLNERAGKFNDPRYSYDGNHEGVDYVPTEYGEQALSTHSGEIVGVRYSQNGYGKYVKIKGLHNGHEYFTYYAHMKEIWVQEGQRVNMHHPLGLVGNSGNSDGVHLHYTWKTPGYGLDGFIVDDVRDPTAIIGRRPFVPPDEGGGHVALFGLHATAEGATLGAEALAQELQVFEEARPGLIKVLSNVDPALLGALVANHPGASWIVRLFLDFGGRSISPAQFVNDTLSDCQRTLGIIGDKPVVIEVHNEPNLVAEGLGSAWQDGRQFGTWLIAVRDGLRDSGINQPLLFPGLSPGPGIDGVRQEAFSFWEQASAAVAAMDAVAVHIYWNTIPGSPDTLEYGLDLLDRCWGALGGKPLWITEASHNQPEDDVIKAAQYVAFWKSLRTRRDVQGVCYFVSSGTAFPDEVWIGRDIARLVGERSG